VQTTKNEVQSRNRKRHLPPITLINSVMTKKLEELFNLPDDDENEPAHPQKQYEVTDIIDAKEDLSIVEKIDEALPRVKGLEASDTEMDELADLAKDAFKDLMDTGMNVEARFANEIFSSASSFLGHAITAKTAKMNKKLKQVELQLKKAKLDMDRGDGPETANGTMLDRNELIEKLLNQNSNKDNK